MNYLFKYIAVPVLVASLATFGIENYVPLKYIDWVNNFNPRIGTTVTTIEGTDTISSSRTTINNNFTALNTGKMEISTTTLPLLTTLANLSTVGTITTGNWNATAIPVSKGGTGTTSPLQYFVMLGNGTNGLTAASSTGTSGQFLTSNGAGTYPSWQSSTVNQTDNYNFTGTYFGVKNLYASSTVANPIYFNDIDYSFPSSETANTCLTTNGSGSLTWATPSFDIGATSTAAGLTGNQVYTHNLGRTPQFIKLELYTTRYNSNEDEIIHITGLATSTALTQSSIYSVATTTIGTVMAAKTGQNTGNIIYVAPISAAVITAQLTAMNSTTFTLNWIVNNNTYGGTLRNILYTVQ